MRRRRHVAIVGGGFSGVALAAQLLRGGDGTLRMTLIESGARFGRGLAYSDGDSRSSPEHARRAHELVQPTTPTHFVRWNRDRTATGSRPADFVARHVYGNYLQETLDRLAADVSAATFCCAGADRRRQTSHRWNERLRRGARGRRRVARRRGCLGHWTPVARRSARPLATRRRTALRPRPLAHRRSPRSDREKRPRAPAWAPA